MSEPKTEKKHDAVETETKGITTGYFKKLVQRTKKKVRQTKKQLQKAEVLKTEEPGFLEKDDTSELITQRDIVKQVDLGSASKKFDLSLNFGPYNIDYSRNGRFLAFCGQRGQVAAVDWLTKRLLFEINVMEEANDITFLHQETMLAVAQNNYTYIYSNQGIEEHCLKNLYGALRLEFLPYHFLLAAATKTSYLHYLDISTGEIVASHPTHLGRLSILAQNPANAVLVTGHSTGTVSMWLPTEKRPVVKMFCHDTGLSSIAVDKSGRYMVTSAKDRKLKVWDIRSMHDVLYEARMPDDATDMCFSQRGLLAAAMKNTVKVFEGVTSGPVTSSYLEHRFHASVRSVQFCPYEDVLGCGLTSGVSSLLCPGSAEANFDALEENPMQNKKARQEREVKRLLDKLPYTTIALESTISSVNRASIEEDWERKKKVLLGETSKVEVVVRKGKQKGRCKEGKILKRKQNLHYERTMFEASNMMGRNRRYKQKAKYQKRPTQSVLDTLMAKR